MSKDRDQVLRSAGHLPQIVRLPVKCAQREGSGNSDSVVSGSLASPKPPDGGEPEERGDEENTTKSRSAV